MIMMMIICNDNDNDQDNDHDNDHYLDQDGRWKCGRWEIEWV